MRPIVVITSVKEIHVALSRPRRLYAFQYSRPIQRYAAVWQLPLTPPHQRWALAVPPNHRCGVSLLHA